MTHFPKPWNKNQQFVLVTKCCKDAQLVKMLVICAMTMSADQLNQHLPVCARLSAVSTNILIQLCWLCNQKLPNMAKFWSLMLSILILSYIYLPGNSGIFTVSEIQWFNWMVQNDVQSIETMLEVLALDIFPGWCYAEASYLVMLDSSIVHSSHSTLWS